MRLLEGPAFHEVRRFGPMLPHFDPSRSCLSEGDATYIVLEVLMWRRVILECFTPSFIDRLQLLFIDCCLLISCHVCSIEVDRAVKCIENKSLLL